MYFGGCEYGIHGSEPGEIVHALQLGIMPMALDGLFCTNALNVAQQNANSKIHFAKDTEQNLIEVKEEDPAQKKMLRRRLNAVHLVASKAEK